MTINGEVEVFRGTIAYFSGDNLGSQLIGGFKQGAQSHRQCRVCMATAEELNEHVLTAY